MTYIPDLIQDRIMKLAKARLVKHPVLIDRLCTEFETGSNATRYMNSVISPFEWPHSAKSDWDFHNIDKRLLKYLDQWVSSQPEILAPVQPIPANPPPLSIPAPTRGTPQAAETKAVDQVQEDPAGPPIDHTLLANPDQLIDAFGTFTGMGQKWFDRWQDKPVLKNANAYKGKRGNAPTPPLFYVFPVMQWLCSPKLKVKGSRPISQSAAWRRLKLKFPVVYSVFQDREPDPMPGK